MGFARRTAVIALVLVIGGSCRFDLPQGISDGGIDAPDVILINRMTFAAMITPLVTECVGCHSAGVAPNLSSFDALDAKYKTKPGAMNILVTKGDAEGGMHRGLPYFIPAEKTTVANWIDNLQ